MLIRHYIHIHKPTLLATIKAKLVYHGSLGDPNPSHSHTTPPTPSPSMNYQSATEGPGNEKRTTAGERPLDGLHVFQLAGFIAACRELLPSIRQGWRDQGHTQYLPMNIMEFLSARLTMTEEDIKKCWSTHCEEILNEGAHPSQHVMAALTATRESVHQLTALNLREYFPNH